MSFTGSVQRTFLRIISESGNFGTQKSFTKEHMLCLFVCLFVCLFLFSVFFLFWFSFFRYLRSVVCGLFLSVFSSFLVLYFNLSQLRHVSLCRIILYDYRFGFSDDTTYESWERLTSTCPCVANIFAAYNQQDATFHNLFISVRRFTCFRQVFRPSSGPQNCTYSVRYLSDQYCYLLHLQY